MKTNHSINTMRLMAAFGVICIHSFASYTSLYRDIISGVSRFAVPFFMMITGYFLYHQDYYLTLHQFKKQIVRFIKIFFQYNILYFFIMLGLNTLQGNAMGYLSYIFNIERVLAFLFLNQSYISEPLWYLGAILYAIIIFYFLIKLKITTFFIPLSIILLSGNLVLGTYNKYIFGQEQSYIYTRNFLFYALPCLLIGYWIHQHKEGIIKKIKPEMSTILLGITFLLLIIEIVIDYLFLTNTNKELYIFTIPFTVFLLFFAIYNPNIGRYALSEAGKKYSFYIYILHPLLVGPCNAFLTSLGFKTLAPFLTIPITFSITLLLSMLLYKITHLKKTRNYSYY